LAIIRTSRNVQSSYANISVSIQILGGKPYEKVIISSYIHQGGLNNFQNTNLQLRFPSFPRGGYELREYVTNCPRNPINPFPLADVARRTNLEFPVYLNSKGSSDIISATLDVSPYYPCNDNNPSETIYSFEGVIGIKNSNSFRQTEYRTGRISNGRRF